MNITSWSGRHLVAFWGFGILGQLLLMALPLMFFAFSGRSDPVAHGFTAVAVERQARHVERYEAGQVAVHVEPREVVHLQTNIGPRSELHAIGGFPWWLPFIVAYLFTIPVGLVIITIIWISGRVRREPPPSPA